MKNQYSAYPASIPTCTDEAAGLILNNIPEAILLFDTSLNLWHCNETAKKEIWQRLKIRLVPGMSGLDLVSPARLPVVKELAKHVLSGQTHTIESEPKINHNTIQTYESTISPARNANGEIVGILVRSTNITERKRASRAVQEAEERWQFAFEASNQAAWDWNMQTDEVIYSSSYKKMYGFLGDELSSDLSEWQRRIHPEDKVRIAAAIAEHTESNNPYYETTYRIQLKNGEYKWIMARGKLVEKDSAGQPLRMIGTHTDLTETLQAKAEINKMNERFHYAAKASSQALWEWNAETGEAYVSPSFTEMFGWQVDENKHFEQWHYYVHPDDRKETVDGYYHVLQHTTDSIWQATYRLLKADDTYAFVADKAYILRNENGKAVKVIGATQDVTALKNVEEELLRSNERFASMMEATNDLLWEWNIGENAIYRSPESLKKFYGIGDENALTTIDQWMDRIHPEDRQNVEDALSRFLKAGRQQTLGLEYRFRCEDGRYADIYDRSILLTDDNGKPVRIIGAAQNISERKQLEADLLQSELEMKKRINQATVDSQEQERTEIGRELHDNVNQILTTTRLYLELAQGNGDMAGDLIKKAGENIVNVISEIRQLSRSLMDPTLGDLGIIDAVHDLVESVNLTRKVVVSLVLDKAIEARLDRAQKLTTFRIIQEALNNVMRHAGATFVNIGIRLLQNETELLITDDGVGFATESVKKGAGLKNIVNRVYLINGQFVLESSPGNGCTIKIKFPIK